MSSLSTAERSKLGKALTPRLNKYIPIRLDPPNPKQIAFLILNDVLEIFYGGAAGGGKSEVLLAGAAQFVDVPGYAALLLRRRYRDLALPGALLDRARSWWKTSDAHWDGINYQWRFPSGALIQFGYMEHEGDEQQYQSAEFQYIGYDELTQMSEQQYTYMFSRLRRPDKLKGTLLDNVPLRMRGASNPGGKGHEWTKKRFGIHMTPTGPQGINSKERIFIFASLGDNPYLDQEAYRKSLGYLSELTRAQLERGDWGARTTGGVFDTSYISVIDPADIPKRQHWLGVLRCWDMAATRPTEADPDPDYTVGTKMIKSSMLPDRTIKYFQQTNQPVPPPPYWIVVDVVRDRQDAGGVEELISATAHRDGSAVPIFIHQERGAAGKLVIGHYKKRLENFNVNRLWVTGDKKTRASLIAARTREGRVFCVDGPYLDSFLDELGLFNPDIEGNRNKAHDDQVDTFSGGYIALDRLEFMEGQGQTKQH